MEEPLRRTRSTIFTVVEAPSYNVILGRYVLSTFKTVISIYYQKIKFSIGRQVGEVSGSQIASRKCYSEMVRTKYKWVRTNEGIHSYRSREWAEVHMVQELPLSSLKNPEEVEWEDVSILLGHLDLITRVTINLDEELKKRLINYLIDHRIIFAWSPQEVRRISSKFIEHRLNIFPYAKPIKQKKRHIGLEKDRLIRVEIDKLLKAGHIREI